ncbi:MAG: transcription factor TFIIIC subunit tfc4 [Thelocarpon impressellum]|nr:MAG: transcription factor TFIIIC subunit tfc4 [Thelocarpon impressellum]
MADAGTLEDASDADVAEDDEEDDPEPETFRDDERSLRRKRAADTYDLSDDGVESSEYEPSDDDREFYTLRSDVADFRRKLTDRPDGNQANPGRDGPNGNGKRGVRRGPRGPQKPVEPSLEIKVLLSRANAAFVAGEYEEAEGLANRIILINDETYAAHALLSGIYLEQGEPRLGIIAFLSAAHLRPNDPSLWRSCAHLILEHGRGNRAEYLKDAIYCFSQLVRIDPKDIESRYERALLVRELGFNGRATHELRQIHEMVPQDTTVLRLLTEVYIDVGEIDKAKQLYRKRISDELNADGSSADGFNWSDVNVFVELFGYQDEYSEGIKELKILSRWLLGREEETYWTEITEDDREWDADEEPRRIMVDGFVPERFDRSSYGEGLPLELRVKLGVYRLKLGHEQLGEALSHFSWLDPENDRPGAILYDYPDLFRETADALQATDDHHEALKFYEPLQQVDDYPDAQLYLQMGASYQGLALIDRAEQCYKTIIENDQNNVEARVQLARMCERLGMSEEAFTYANEVLLLTQRGDGARVGTVQGSYSQTDAFLPASVTSQNRITKKRARLTAEEREEHEIARKELIQMQYVKLQAVRSEMRRGDDAATEKWMKAAGVLIQEFRSSKVFYPWDKYVKFLGYTAEARKRASKSKSSEIVMDMEAMAERLQASIEESETDKSRGFDVPRDFRGIEFDEWLDIFLEYALCLAKMGRATDSYEIINSAYDAIVFYHSPDRVFLIHLCWAACALFLQDDETICTVSRWFMKEYQFTTDTYRLYAALHRVCQTPTSWYNSGPAQKFLLRQIRAMDESLGSAEARQKRLSGRTSGDVDGNQHGAGEMDVALLMLYGQVLYAGTGYFNAFNYFFRAYHLDPRNPLINLSIALAYLHHSLKRQCDNRHYLIAQGLAFLFAYYDLRQQQQQQQHPGSVHARQEVEYNVARAYHLLGLTHLALPYYEKVLALSRSGAALGPACHAAGDLARHAAYNLQHLYAAAGNLALAKAVTEEHLVI